MWEVASVISEVLEYGVCRLLNGMQVRTNIQASSSDGIQPFADLATPIRG